MNLQNENLSALALVIFAGIFTAHAQNTEVPLPVKSAFEQKVTNAKDVEWEYDSGDNLWEAEYKIGRDKYTSAFDENGKWIETEMEMRRSGLPKQVVAGLQAGFSGYDVEEVELVETPDGSSTRLKWKRLAVKLNLSCRSLRKAKSSRKKQNRMNSMRKNSFFPTYQTGISTIHIAPSARRPSPKAIADGD